MSGQTSADTTESLVLQRLRALGMVETKNQQREQNNFHDSGAIPNLESRKKVFMDQGGAKNDDYNASNQADSPTVAQRLAALHKKTECDVDSEKLENVGTVKERCKALHTQQTPIGEKNSKGVASSIRVFETQKEADMDTSKVNNVKKKFEQSQHEPAKDSTISQRVRELSTKKQEKVSQVRQLASKLETKQKTEKPVHSTLARLKEKFEATGGNSAGASRLSKFSASQSSKHGGYVMETTKLFGGATVFKFSDVSKSTNSTDKNTNSNETNNGSNVQSKVMFYIQFQQQRKDEAFSKKASSDRPETDSQRFSSVAELRALFGTPGKPDLQKLLKKNLQEGNATNHSNSEANRSEQISEQEEGDVMLEQALCRRILGKEVRRALKALLAQQRLDALKCQATEKDVEGREVKPLIDEFQQGGMDDSERVGVFTNRMRKGRITQATEMEEQVSVDFLFLIKLKEQKVKHEVEDKDALELEPDTLAMDDRKQEEFVQEHDKSDEKSDTVDDEEGFGYNSYEIVIDPDFVRRRINELQQGGEDGSDDEDDDEDDDDEPVLIKTRSGRIVVDTSQYQKMSVRMAMRIAL